VTHDPLPEVMANARQSQPVDFNKFVEVVKTLEEFLVHNR